jgi:hypothetical protein
MAPAVSAPEKAKQSKAAESAPSLPSFSPPGQQANIVAMTASCPPAAQQKKAEVQSQSMAQLEVTATSSEAEASMASLECILPRQYH